MKLDVKKDRLEINKIIENCLPIIKQNKNFTQECADAIILYLIENTVQNKKRQGLIVTLNQLHNLIEELEDEFEWDGSCRVTDDDRKFQINIINKTPECSDTWIIEINDKKDKDDSSNVALSGDTKPFRGKNNKYEHMPNVVDNHVDNPQDDSGAVTSAAREDTDESIFPADSIQHIKSEGKEDNLTKTSTVTH